jgi:hypothetical protein
MEMIEAGSMNLCEYSRRLLTAFNGVHGRASKTLDEGKERQDPRSPVLDGLAVTPRQGRHDDTDTLFQRLGDSMFVRDLCAGSLRPTYAQHTCTLICIDPPRLVEKSGCEKAGRGAGSPKAIPDGGDYLIWRQP